MTNAIKYTPSGGTIRISVEHILHDPKTIAEQEGVDSPIKHPEEVAVHIKDTGIGIPEDALESVFDRFFRVEKKVHTIKGTGLGLTIVKKIIEKHRGRLGVVSALGEGSTFSFYLPVLSFDDLEDEVGELNPAVSGEMEYDPVMDEYIPLEKSASKGPKRTSFVVASSEDSLAADDDRNIPEVSSSDNIDAVTFDGDDNDDQIAPRELDSDDIDDLTPSEEDGKNGSDRLEEPEESSEENKGKVSRTDNQTSIAGSELAEGATASESQ